MAGPVRYAMIGGGEGAFIGPVHRTAAAIAGNCRLVAGGAVGRSEQGAGVGRGDRAAAERSYASFQALIRGEALLPAAERAEFVAIVTPPTTSTPPQPSPRSRRGWRC